MTLHTLKVMNLLLSRAWRYYIVDLDSEGETLDKEEVFGSIEAVKTVSDLFMPVSGEVIEYNQSLNDNPELINSDPYGKDGL